MQLRVEALSKQDPERPVYRSLVNILLEVDDRESLESELRMPKKHLTSISKTRREGESIRKKYEEMVESFERA